MKHAWLVWFNVCCRSKMWCAGRRLFALLIPKNNFGYLREALCSKKGEAANSESDPLEEYMIVYGQANQSTGEAWLAATGLAYVTACLRAYPLGQTDVTDSVRCRNSYCYCRCMARICLTDFSEHFICLRFPPQSSPSIFICINFTVFSEHFICLHFFSYRILTFPFVHVFDWIAVPLNNFSEYCRI